MWSSASVRSPLIDASATFALKLGAWFRRGSSAHTSPDSMGPACPSSGRNSTYLNFQDQLSALNYMQMLNLVGLSRLHTFVCTFISDLLLLLLPSPLQTMVWPFSS
jgi:hypothetical protein